MISFLIWVVIIFFLGKWILGFITTINDDHDTSCYYCGKRIKFEYTGKYCPHCQTVIIPEQFKKELGELTAIKNRLSIWKTKNKINAEEYARLIKLAENEHETVLKEIRKLTEPVEAVAPVVNQATAKPLIITPPAEKTFTATVKKIFR